MVKLHATFHGSPIVWLDGNKNLESLSGFVVVNYKTEPFDSVNYNLF